MTPSVFVPSALIASLMPSFIRPTSSKEVVWQTDEILAYGYGNKYDNELDTFFKTSNCYIQIRGHCWCIFTLPITTVIFFTKFEKLVKALNVGHFIGDRRQ